MIAIMAPQLLAGGFAMFDKALPAFMDLSFLTTTRLIHGGAIRLRAIKSLGNVRELDSSSGSFATLAAVRRGSSFHQ
jgi:hypothetical protein